MSRNLSSTTGFCFHYCTCVSSIVFQFPGAILPFNTVLKENSYNASSPPNVLNYSGVSTVAVVQLLSLVRLLVTPWTVACQAPLSFAISRSLLRIMPIESVMISNHLILCHPLLLLPPIFPSITVFSSKSALCIRWPKYWSFSFSISPSNEDSGLISFRIDWLELLATQRTLKGLLQHHNTKDQFFSAQPFLRSNSHIQT